MYSRREQIAVYDFPRTGSGRIAPSAGPVFVCDTENGATQDTAKDRNHAVNTMDAILDKIDALPASDKSDGIIYLRGHVREQVTAPLGAYGWRIIGLAGGRPRHATADGVDINGNGVHWSEAATATNAPLLILRQQGWEIENVLFVPESGYGAVQLRRDESATYPDASHSVFRNVRFISPGTRVGYGIDDIGQNYNLLVEDCEFENLEYAYNPSAGGAWGGAAPGHHRWLRNTFKLNKTDITGNFAGSRFEGNLFYTPYDVTTHPTTLNLAVTSSAGAATNVNYVIGNTFADAAGNVTIAKGYKPATGDIWRNYVSDTAAQIVTVPA